MIRGLYDAATALDAAMYRQEVTAENLAHISTPGYRSRGVAFERFDAHLPRPDQPAVGASGVAPPRAFTDFTPGPIRSTGSPYHLALNGDAFFALQSPAGTVYTRNGSFRLGPDGALLSDGNYPVLGAGGPITLPPDARRFAVGQDGTVTADGVFIDRLQLTRFTDPQQLRRVGPTLFAASPQAGPEPADRGVVQGGLEAANVSAAAAMVEMVQTARSFEAAQRAMRAIADAVQQKTRTGQ